MIQANEITSKAADALATNGAEITTYDDESIVLVELPEGTEQVSEDVFRLPDGSQIGFHQEGDYVEGTTTICLK